MRFRRQDIDPRAGFTIFELVVFSAIFTLTSAAFISILLAMTRVQLRQQSAAEINQQSQFLIQTIQRYVEQSSLIELPSDSATSTLKLRMSSSSYDPTYVFLSTSTVWLRETDAGAAQPLTSEKIRVSELSFTRTQNAVGRDTVLVTYTLSYNTSSTVAQVTQTVRQAIGRTNAAIFQSSVSPSVGNVYKIGTSTRQWLSINDVLHFSSDRVGIGTQDPQQRLEVVGGARLNTGAGRPGCNSGLRGTFWATQSGGGAADITAVCIKTATDTYTWFSF